MCVCVRWIFFHHWGCLLMTAIAEVRLMQAVKSFFDELKELSAIIHADVIHERLLFIFF